MKKLKIKVATKTGYQIADVNDSVNLEQPNSKTRRGRVGREILNTLTTSCNQGVVDKTYKIRRITPLEAWRAMGFSDDDFYKIRNINSDSQIYKQVGNSIVKNVMVSILKNLL